MRTFVGLVAALSLLLGTAASAHKPSDSYLSLTVGERTIDGRWDIALRDLEHAIGLDRDGDGAITWGELRARHDTITAYALARLSLSTNNAPCSSRATEHLVDHHSDGAYAVLRFTAECPASIDDLEVRYSLLFELDPLHRGLVQAEVDGATHTAVLGPERSNWRLSRGGPDLVHQFVTYFRDGVWHIWIGLDHVLFLISLLLPAVLNRRSGFWQPVEHFGEAFLEVVKVVTAFTLAHSVTLGLAALQIISLPSRLVESVIAASVVVAALNNLYPVITRRLWLVAFGFGLIHGFGFASVLLDIGLPRSALLLSLLSFNLGVEVGQLAIVAVFMPLAFALRCSPLYRQLALRLGSLAIITLATLWLIERAFGVT